MFRSLSVLGASLALTATCLTAGLTQTQHYPVRVIKPESSRGSVTSSQKVHTNLEVLETSTKPPHPGAKPLIGSGIYGTFSPSDLRSYYKVPSTAKGHGFIVIVDAFDTSTVVSDFNSFSSYYSLPTENGTGNALQVINLGAAAGSANSTGWDLEACLDTQWAHAMAPNAVIVLVEAASNSYADMFNAVAYARSGPAAEVSMSWSGGEGGASAGTEAILSTGNGINFASTGDSGAFYALYGNYAGYPASSPNVVAAGGTTTITNSLHHLVTTMGWEESGGGPSAVFSKPSYQSAVVGTDPTYRSMPDVSANADPNTPVGIWNTSYFGSTYLFYIGGTSESSPVLAAIQNDSNHSYASTFAFLTHLYANLDTAGCFNDVKTGYNGFLAGDD